MGKIEEKAIEERARKAAFDKAVRIGLIFMAPWSILGSVIALTTEVSGGVISLILLVIGGFVLLFAYVQYYEDFLKRFSEEVERGRE